jgi:hypothetical protein
MEGDRTMTTALQNIDPMMAVAWARTALDDPGVAVDEQGRTVEGIDYAIDRCDDALRILREDHEPDELRAALSYHGQALARIADELRQESGDDPQRYAANAIDDGLDQIDEAIAALTEED